ncbi:hypothetical protein, partial [Paracidovorax cattleyae]
MSTPFAEPGGARAEHAAGAAHSRFHQRLQRRYAGETGLLPPGAPTRQTMAEALQALCARGHDTG